jgi:hypothetical protein
MQRKKAVGFGLWAFAIALCGLSARVLSQVVPADPQVSFRIIVVSSADRAAQVADRVRQGADFAALAQTESLDPSASRGASSARLRFLSSAPICKRSCAPSRLEL